MGAGTFLHGATALVLAGLLPVSPLRADTVAPHDCDKTAAHPQDPHAVAPGIAWFELEPVAVIRACRAALELHPGEARFYFQLGRGFQRSGLLASARQAYQRAADAGYLSARVNLALLLNRNDEEVSRAGRLLADAALESHPVASYMHGLALLEAGQSRDGLRELQRSAELGYGVAALRLGQLYLTGQQVRADEVLASQWLREAARLADVEVLMSLGHLYSEGRLVEPDPRKAYALFESAHDAGHTGAAKAIARLFLRRDALGLDIGEAVRWLERGAEIRTDLSEKMRLYQDFVLPDGDSSAALLPEGALQEVAASGSGPARLALGLRAWFDRAREPERALERLAAAAAGGSALPAHLLGELYAGRGDGKSAVEWFRTAGRRGLAMGYRRAGQLLESGASGLTRSPDQAQAWLRSAARAGDIEAKVALAKSIGRSAGDNWRAGQARIEAGRWFEEAAFEGHRSARLEYARLLVRGQNGVRRDVRLAVELLNLVAHDGVNTTAAGSDLDEPGQALRDLAELMELGDGVPYDLAGAAQLYRQLAQRDRTARERLWTMVDKGYRPPEPMLGETIELLTAAAALGGASAHLELALVYHRALGTERDTSRALFHALVAQRLYRQANPAYRNAALENQIVSLTRLVGPEPALHAVRRARQWQAATSSTQ